MIRLELIILVLRTMDDSLGKQLTKVAGTWMNRVGIFDSVKRPVGRKSTDANEQRKRQHNQSYDYNIKYCIIRVYIIYFMNYITIKVALPVFGLGIIRIFYYNISLVCLFTLVNFDPLGIFLHDGGSIYLAPRSVIPVFSVRGIDLLAPPGSPWGGRIPRDTGSPSYFSVLRLAVCTAADSPFPEWCVM